MTLRKLAVTTVDERRLTVRVRLQEGADSRPDDQVASFRGHPLRDESGKLLGVPLRSFGPWGADAFEDHPEADRPVYAETRRELLAAALKELENESAANGDWDMARLEGVRQVEGDIEVRVLLRASEGQITYPDDLEAKIALAVSQAFDLEEAPAWNPPAAAPGR